MPFREPKLSSGNFILGLDLHNQPIRTCIQYLNAHSLTSSNSGGGKTTKTRFYILQITPRIQGTWLWDLRKTEFRILRPYLKRVNCNLIILPARSIKFNPLQLPLEVPPSDWVPRVADMLIMVLDLPPRASKLMQTKLFELYHQFGIFDGTKSYPTLFDLHQTIKDDNKANSQARMAIVDSLEPVLWSLGPEVLAWRYGWTSHDLAQQKLVFEMAGVSEVDKNLLLNSLLLSEFTSRIARGISNPKMDLWISIDEAQRIAARTGTTSAIADQIGLIRGSGVGLDLSILSSDNTHPQIISNTAGKCLGRCGSAADYQTAGHNMSLTTAQIQWAHLNLEPGLFIGQLGEGPWRHPFVFRIPPMNFSSGDKTETVEPDRSPLKQLPVAPAPVTP